MFSDHWSKIAFKTWNFPVHSVYLLTFFKWNGPQTFTTIDQDIYFEIKMYKIEAWLSFWQPKFLFTLCWDVYLQCLSTIGKSAFVNNLMTKALSTPTLQKTMKYKGNLTEHKITFPTKWQKCTYDLLAFNWWHVYNCGKIGYLPRKWTFFPAVVTELDP